jgi:hypothetical protein
MLLVDAGADSCCNFFWIKEDDFTYDTARMHIKQEIVNMGIAGHQAAVSSSRRCTPISTRHILL